MYAIRSYYVIAYLDESSKIRILCGNGSNLQSYSLPLASENTFVKAGSAPLIAVISPREFGYNRITSYNVCYTKLLRIINKNVMFMSPLGPNSF